MVCNKFLKRWGETFCAMGTGSRTGWRRVRRGLSGFFCGNIFLEIFLRLIALQSRRGQCVRAAGGPRFVVEGMVRTVMFPAANVFLLQG